MNVSRTKIAENRININKLFVDLQNIDSKMANFSRQLDKKITQIEGFVQVYIQIDEMLERVKQLIQQAMFSLEHLSLQLNMLSLGHLSPSVIKPEELMSLLLDIKSQLPPSLKMPKHVQNELWEFYRILTCTTIFENSNILVIMSIPLLDHSEMYEVYVAHNLPVPFNKKDQLLGNNDFTAVAQYDLETTTFAINKERTKFVLLSTSEALQCTNPLTGFCTILSPIYSVNANRFCLLSLFMKTTETIKVNCQTTVRMKTGCH